jgi:capsular polysaccharide biosynthesis protein
VHPFRRAPETPKVPVDTLQALIAGEPDLARRARGHVVHLVPQSRAAPGGGAGWTGAATSLTEVPVVGADELDDSAPARQEALALDLELDRLGPLDLIVDDSGAGLSRLLRRWERLFLHLGAGGAYVIRDPRPSSVVVETVRTLFPEPPGAELKEASRTLRGARHQDGYTVLTAETGHVLKIRDSGVDRAAGWAPGLGVDTLARVPSGVEVQTGATVVSHAHSDAVTLPALPVEYPELVLRHFRGDIEVRSNLLTVSANAVLPPSFNHPQVAASRNRQLRSVNERIAVLEPESDLPTLPGTYYDFSCAEPGHFGHVMTEAVAKLWGLDMALAAHQDLRCLVRVPDDDYVPAVERALLGAFGIGEERIEWVASDVRVTSLISASLAWQNAPPYYFHPAIRETWARARSALVSRRTSAPARIFLSRRFSDTNRSCRNIEEVEAFFRDRGYAVVQPEQLPFEQQVDLVGNAEVVAGFAGSAMFNMLFANRAKTFIVLLHESYTARNEWLYAHGLGVELHYFWSPADIRQPRGRYDERAFHSPWAFDLERNAAELEAVM